MTSDAVKAELEDIASFAKWVGLLGVAFAAQSAAYELCEDHSRYLLAASCAANDVWRAVLEIDVEHPALPVLKHVDTRLHALWVES